MGVHLMREVDRLKKTILGLSAMVEETVERSVQAVTARNSTLARQVVEGDREIDAREVEIEEECLKILALHQPVATDLRFIVAVLKMNSDLERIGDMAVSICRHAIRLAELSGVAPPFDITPMAAKVRSMLSRTLDALVNVDAALAAEVMAMDEEVDEMNRAMAEQALGADHSSRAAVETVHRYVLIARSLERMGDHAKNVCEDVIYLVKGDIVRHAGAEAKAAG